MKYTKSSQEIMDHLEPEAREYAEQALKVNPGSLYHNHKECRDGRDKYSS